MSGNVLIYLREGMVYIVEGQEEFDMPMLMPDMLMIMAVAFSCLGILMS